MLKEDRICDAVIPPGNALQYVTLTIHEAVCRYIEVELIAVIFTI